MIGVSTTAVGWPEAVLGARTPLTPLGWPSPLEVSRETPGLRDAANVVPAWRPPAPTPGGHVPAAGPQPSDVDAAVSSARAADVGPALPSSPNATLTASPAGAVDSTHATIPASEAQRQVAPALSAAPDEQLPRPAEPRVITVANQKGGVGKTTSTVNLAAALAQAGLRVLVIDTDPQGNASTALGIDHRPGTPSIYEVLVDDVPLAEVVRVCPDLPNLWCAPATIDLAGAEVELISFVARETRLERAISAYLRDAADGPDFVLIDCPPSLGLLTLNAFVAGREVLIPIQCEYYALEGLSMLLKNIEMIRKHLNPDLFLSAILLTMYDARTRLSAQVADEVRTHFPDLVLNTRVPRSVRISEAPSHGLTVMSYDPTSTGALSYAAAAAEIATMEAKRSE